MSHSRFEICVSIYYVLFRLRINSSLLVNSSAYKMSIYSYLQVRVIAVRFGTLVVASRGLRINPFLKANVVK